jgi:RNA polymerase sigma-70 factor (ECF subfamily)
LHSFREQLLADYLRQNQQRFYRLAYSYVKNQDEALDIVQDSIVKAMENLHSLRNPEAMRTWFTRIVVNESLSHLRKNQRLVPLEEAPEPVSSGSEENQVLDRLDLWQALSTLPPPLKTVVLLRYFEDMKLSDIALVTGCPLNTAKARLYRALAQLKTQLHSQKGRDLI